MSYTIVTITGPSGSGKSTLERALIEKNPELFNRVISMTTRPPREGEVDGVDYYFVSNAEFLQRINAGQILEYAEFAGNYYGTPVSGLMTEKVNIAVMEPIGLRQISKYCDKSGDIHYAVYLDGKPEDLVERVIKRHKNGVSGSEIDYLAKRVKVLMSEEVNWLTNLRNDGIRINFVSVYNEFTALDSQDLITNTAAALLDLEIN